MPPSTLRRMDRECERKEQGMWLVECTVQNSCLKCGARGVTATWPNSGTNHSKRPTTPFL